MSGIRRGRRYELPAEPQKGAAMEEVGPATNTTLVGRVAAAIQKRVTEHDHDGYEQWYADEHVIDCDTEVLCRIAAEAAIAEIGIKPWV